MKDDLVYLYHIRDFIKNILEYTQDGKEYYFSDAKTRDAVVRNLEVIGEATKNISEDLRNSYPDIPWKQMAGMRDKIIHEYFGVNQKVIWNVVENEIVGLQTKINSIIDILEKNKTS